MSTVKNFSFTLVRAARPGDNVTWHKFDTTARTLAEAQADFRHYLRVHHPEVLDDVAAWNYHCEVRHV